MLPDRVRQFLRKHSRNDSADLTRAALSAAAVIASEERIEAVQLQRTAEIACKGGRNNAGFWLACQLRDHGYSQADARIVMDQYRSQVSPTDTKGRREPYTQHEGAFKFARFAGDLAMRYPAARTIHLVMDNLNIHHRKSLTDAFGEEVGGEIWDQFTIHYTPTHGSWLNQAEIEISLLARQCLGTRRIPDLKTLRREVRLWSRRMNKVRQRINWRFDRKAARLKFGYKTNSFKRSKTKP